MLGPGSHEALDIYGQPAYDLYNQLRHLVPGFIDPLDISALALYVVTLIQIDEIKQQKKAARNKQSETLLKEILEDHQDLALKQAEQLGLTPKSRKMITDHL